MAKRAGESNYHSSTLITILHPAHLADIFRPDPVNRRLCRDDPVESYYKQASKDDGGIVIKCLTCACVMLLSNTTGKGCPTHE